MTDITVQQYRPSEIIAIFNDLLTRQNTQTGGRLVCIRGIYMSRQSDPRWQAVYATLHDEATQDELTIRLTQQQAQSLTSGNLVEILGTLGRTITSKGLIQLTLNVSRIEVVQNQVIDEDEQKRIELRQKKAAVGFKNVDALLENLLFTDQRPKVALVFATTSITMSDFNAGINAAKAAIDFVEYRVNFAKANELCSQLKAIDSQKFSVIALVRGGGGGTEHLDDPSVIESVVNLHTPLIAAVGHVEEKIYVKQVADKVAPTPNGLGQYFSEMVENVSEKKTKSRAALTEQIKKQFQDQLSAGQKQNKDLQERLDKLTKAQEEAQKQHKTQIEAANKQNADLQKQLADIQKSNKEQQEAAGKQLEQIQKTHQQELTKLGETHKTQLVQLNETQTKLQQQLKSQQEDANKRSKELNDSIQKMQETNGSLQKSLSQLTAQNTQAAKDLNIAKDRARELERQLEKARNNNGSNTTTIVAVILTALATLAVSYFIFG